MAFKFTSAVHQEYSVECQIMLYTSIHPSIHPQNADLSSRASLFISLFHVTSHLLTHRSYVGFRRNFLWENVYIMGQVDVVHYKKTNVKTSGCVSFNT